MADKEYLVKSLKRIYDECEKLQERENPAGVGGVADKFNEILPQFKEAYPDDEIIQDMGEVSVNTRPQGMKQWPSQLQAVKMNTLTLADRLDINTEQFEDASSAGPMNVIRLEQNQSVSQSVSVTTLVEQVNSMMMKESDKDELKKVIKDFEEETEKEDPDRGRLEQYLDTAREYRPEVALRLGMLALQKGIDVLI